jgi:hypothetical protein
MQYYIHTNGDSFAVVDRETQKVYTSIAGVRAHTRALDLLDQLNGLKPRRVILESPFGSDDDAIVARNIRYARACVRDCVLRGEAPIASHLLFTQPGILKDRDKAERKLGIEAGLAWAPVATASVFYTDLGVTPGMEQGRERAVALHLPIENREIGGDWHTPMRVDHDVAAFIRVIRNYFSVVSPENRLPEVEREYMEDADRLLKRLENEPWA